MSVVRVPVGELREDLAGRPPDGVVLSTDARGQDVAHGVKRAAAGLDRGAERIFVKPYPPPTLAEVA